MTSPILLYLPEPVGWIALTPEALREAQLRASEVIGAAKAGDQPVERPQASECVSAKEAARVLGVDASWLLKRARMRKVPFLKVGKYCRFDVEALRAHLAKEAAK